MRDRMTETDLCECDRPDEVDNPHRHPLDVACIYWIAGRPDASARRAAAEGRLPLTAAQQETRPRYSAEEIVRLREALGLNIAAQGDEA